jgi:hypothetical protein
MQEATSDLSSTTDPSKLEVVLPIQASAGRMWRGCGCRGQQLRAKASGKGRAGGGGEGRGAKDGRAGRGRADPLHKPGPRRFKEIRRRSESKPLAALERPQKQKPKENRGGGKSQKKTENKLSKTENRKLLLSAF